MANLHAALTPSSAERWVSCPGSVSMSLPHPGEEEIETSPDVVLEGSRETGGPSKFEDVRRF